MGKTHNARFPQFSEEGLGGLPDRISSPFPHFLGEETEEGQVEQGQNFGRFRLLLPVLELSKKEKTKNKFKTI